jgi:hypothetical protein
MFIKKDLRKIEDILHDPNDNREIMKLAKRAAEFQGSVRVICHEQRLPALANLKVLNLYDNCISNLTAIGILANTPLEELNLGCNNIQSLPLEVSYQLFLCSNSCIFSSVLVKNLSLVISLATFRR